MIAILLSVFAAAIAFTGAVRAYALKKHVLDIPGARSSHMTPMPRGGGVGIVMAYLVGLGLLLWTGAVEVEDASYIVLPGLLTAVIGFVDDHKHVPARWRLLGHLVSASLGLAFLPAWPVVPFWNGMSLGGVWLGLPLLIGLVWLVNLYNFMDGIDGLAGVQCVTVSLGLGLFAFMHGDHANAWVALLLAMAAAGFLYWNFPPARIFMGDAGSGFLGIAIGLLWLKIAQKTPELFWPGLILMGVFVVDATYTLLVRFCRGQRLHEAHRSHAYQRAAQQYRSHWKVTVSVGIINITVLGPLAFLCSVSTLPMVWVIISFAGLIALCSRYKPGR